MEFFKLNNTIIQFPIENLQWSFKNLHEVQVISIGFIIFLQNSETDSFQIDFIDIVK